MGIYRKDPEPDPQDAVPADLRDRWALVPKFELTQLFLAGFLIGAGTLASVVGFVSGPKWLWYGFPAALVLCRLQALLFEKASDRLVDELAARQREGGSDGAASS